jgi:hypothetical protein
VVAVEVAHGRVGVLGVLDGGRQQHRSDDRGRGQTRWDAARRG